MFNFIQIEKAADITPPIPIGEGKQNADAESKFGKLLKSIVDENVGGKKDVHKGEKNAQGQAMSTEGSVTVDREKEKQAGLLGVFLGYYLNEEDIAKLFPDGLEKISPTDKIDLSELVGKIEAALNEKVAAGLGSNFAKHPKEAIEELKATFATSLETNPKATLSLEDLRKIMLQANEIRVNNNKTEALTLAPIIPNEVVPNKEQTTPLMSSIVEEVGKNNGNTNTNPQVVTENISTTKNSDLNLQNSSMPKTDSIKNIEIPNATQFNTERPAPEAKTFSVPINVETEVEVPVVAMDNRGKAPVVEQEKLIGKTAVEGNKTETFSLKTESLSKVEFIDTKIGANADNKNNNNSDNKGSNDRSMQQPEVNKAKPINSGDTVNSKEPVKDFNNIIRESLVQTKDGVGEISKTFDVREPRDISRLVRNIETIMNGKGESSITVTLRPDNLGRLEIRLMEIAGKLTAKFVTDNETSHKLMVSHGEIIRQQLSEKGIVIDNMDFGFKDASTRGDSGDGRRSSKSSQNRKNFSDEQSDEADGEISSLNDARSNNNAVYA